MPPRKANKSATPTPPKKAAAAKANQKSTPKNQRQAPVDSSPVSAVKLEFVDQKHAEIPEEQSLKDLTTISEEEENPSGSREEEKSLVSRDKEKYLLSKEKEKPSLLEENKSSSVLKEEDKAEVLKEEDKAEVLKEDEKPAVLKEEDEVAKGLETGVSTEEVKDVSSENDEKNDKEAKQEGGGDMAMVEACEEETKLKEDPKEGNEDKDEEMPSAEGKGEVEAEHRGSVVKKEKNAEKTSEGEDYSEMQKALHISERRQRKKVEIFVGGLEKSATEEDLTTAFKEVGVITEIRLMKDLQHPGKNKGYAFVRYATPAEAKRAVQELANVKIRGKRCGVVPLEENDTIFLGNIDKTWKKDDVLNKLKEAEIQNIENITVVEDPHNPELNRGFAFLELETNKDAQIAFRALQKKNAFGKDRTVKVAWAQPLNEPDEEVMAQVKSVFVDGLPSTWNEEQVKEHFGKFGDIEKVVLARNMQSAKRKDFGFVNYTTRDAAIACIEILSKADGLNDGDSKVKVKVSLAKPSQKGKSGKGDTKGTNKGDSKGSNKGGSQVHILKSNYAHTALGTASGKGLLGRAGQSAPTSTTNELLQVLREQAAWGQGHLAVGGGASFGDYGRVYIGNAQFPGGHHGQLDQSYRLSHLQSATPVQGLSHAGVKRAYSAMGEDVYGDPRGNPRARLDGSFVAGGSSMYGGLSQQQTYHNQGRPHPAASTNYSASGYQTYGSQRSSAQGGRKGGTSGPRSKN